MSFISLETLLNPNKILPFYLNRAESNKKIFPPISAEIHWTSNCNYDCTHCSYGSRRQTTNYLTGEIIETIHQRFGFRQSEVKGNQLFVNGKPIKLRGVNRHEVYPLTGRVVPKEMYREDVELFR